MNSPGRVTTLIVSHEISEEPRNAFWQLLSARQDRINFGIANYDWHREDRKRILKQLLKHYELEGITMPKTIDDILEECSQEWLDEKLADPQDASQILRRMDKSVLEKALQLLDEDTVDDSVKEKKQD